MVFQGTVPELLEDGRGLTGKFLRGELSIGVPVKRRRGNGLELVIRGARAHNLKDVDRAHPARRLHLRHGRLRIGQVDPGPRRPVRRAPGPRRGLGEVGL